MYYTKPYVFTRFRQIGFKSLNHSSEPVTRVYKVILSVTLFVFEKFVYREKVVLLETSM